ncbi:MAG: T9SS type A sorting domain-containing protein, partial [Cytophagaceae bacterium]
AATSGANPDFATNNNPTTFTGTILFGLYIQGSSSASTWLTSGGTSSNNSYLPSQLNVANGSIAFGASAAKGQYTGSRTNQATFAAYRTAVNNPANWTTTSGSGTITMNVTPFTLASGPTASVLSGTSTICAGENASLAVAVTGGTSPFTVVYSNGTDNFTVNGYVSGSAILVSPADTTTFTLVSVTDANGISGTNNSGSAVVTVNQLYPFYTDADFDGFGAGTTTTLVCAVNATTPPAGFSTVNTDCNDNVGAINPGASEIAFNGIDDNCNGTIDEGSQLFSQVVASQCGTTLAAINSVINATNLGSQANGYRFRVVNTLTNEVQTLDRPVPTFQLTALASYDYATTYSISVMVRRNGVWLNYYGNSCLVSTPAVFASGGAATVNPSLCGGTIPSLSTLIATTSLQGVTGYRFRITNLTDPTAPNQVQILDRTVHYFALTMLSTYTYGTTYAVEVAVKTTGTVFSGFGAPCQITTAAVPTLVNCGGTATTASTLNYTTSMNRATSYRFELTNMTTFVSTTVDRPSHYFSFGNIAGYTPGATYAVRIAIMTAGTYSVFSEACMLTAPGAARSAVKGDDDTDAPASVTFRAIGYPNPYVESFYIDMDTQNEAKVNVRVYDMTGKLLDDREFNPETIESQNLGERYPSGVYNVIVTQGENVKTLRMIKR